MRYYGLGPAAKEAQQVIDQLALRGLAGDEGLGVSRTGYEIPMLPWLIC